MPVTNTESRLPQGYKASDLGQATVSPSGYFALVSYLTSPILVNRINHYVLFVLDEDIRPDIDRYHWMVYGHNGYAYLPIHQEVTTEGVFQYKPTAKQKIKVVVHPVDTQGTSYRPLELEHSVCVLSPLFGNLIAPLSQNYRTGRFGKPAIEIGNFEATNETANELYQYILDSLAEPINGQANEIPFELLTCIMYREMLFSPKSFASYKSESRNAELDRHRAGLNGTWSWGDWRGSAEGNSLGVSQTQPQTLASMLINPSTGTTYTPFLQSTKAQNNGSQISANRLTNYKALPLEDRIDLYNLLRFPKTCVRMANTVLLYLKNRSHRVPSHNAATLLGDQKALQVIATEYNIGPTDTSWANVGSNNYGREVYAMIQAPLFAQIPHLSLISMEVWGQAIDKATGAALANVRVDIYWTELRVTTALKCWEDANGYTTPGAPTTNLSTTTDYMVLEVIRDYNGTDNDLTKIKVTSPHWVKEEGWCIIRSGSTYYGHLSSVSTQNITRTNSQGEFSIASYHLKKVKLRFVKEADVNGNGYFDFETPWIQPPDFTLAKMESSDYLIKEEDIIDLLPDWEDHAYGWTPKYPAGYHIKTLGINENNSDTIACNTFTEAIILQAWKNKYPTLNWDIDMHNTYMIIASWLNETTNPTSDFDEFGPVTIAVDGDGTVKPAIKVDITSNIPPPPWCVTEGWSNWAPYYDANDGKVKGISGHSVFIVDYHPGSKKLLVLEANESGTYSLDGVGFRYLGNIEDNKDGGNITPNKDHIWIEKLNMTWKDFKDRYDALSDPDNSIDSTNPNSMGIARLKVYDLKWSAANTL
ncbi:MAG: hypothetical protein AAFV95_21950 [Bacteroidota bacterium]